MSNIYRGRVSIRWDASSLILNIASWFPCEFTITDMKPVEDISNHWMVKEINVYAYAETQIRVTIKYVGSHPDTVLTNLASYNWIPTLQSYFGLWITTIGTLVQNDVRTDTSYLQALQQCVSTDVNAYFLFKMNSPKKQVTKNITFVSCDECVYNSPISHKEMELTMTRGAYDTKFNYIYLLPFKRFYYVDKIVYSKNVMVLTLIEDVLMSFDELIRSQTAYVTRNENNYDSDKIDEFVTYDYDKSKTYTTITPTNDYLAFGETPEKRFNFVFVTAWGVS